MKNLKIILMIMLFLGLLPLQAESNITHITSGESEPETDDKLNPELLNTLPAVNILNLSGRDHRGLLIKDFLIQSIADSNTGILYLADARTEVTVGQYLTLEASDGIRFDPNENFEGNATFTYSAIDSNAVVDSTPATVTLPIVGTIVNGENHPIVCSEHDTNCTCEPYKKRIPTLSKFGLLGMFMLTIIMGILFLNREL